LRNCDCRVIIGAAVNPQKNLRSRNLQSFIGLAVSLLLPAAYVIHKYAGYAGLALLLPIALLFLYVCFNRAEKIAGRAAQLPKTAFIAVEVVIFSLLLAILLVVYPIADSPALGRGSDTQIPHPNSGIPGEFRGHLIQLTNFCSGIPGTPYSINKFLLKRRQTVNYARASHFLPYSHNAF
jgi:hypothetical protein